MDLEALEMNSIQISAVDFIQYVWKQTFGIDHSKTKIKNDLKQGAVRLNDRKISVDDVFEVEIP